MSPLRAALAVMLAAVAAVTGCGGQSTKTDARSTDHGAGASGAGTGAVMGMAGTMTGAAGVGNLDPTSTRCTDSQGTERVVTAQDLCDGTALCADGRDEAESACPFGVGYHCRGTALRIERRRVCDGVNDCPDGDDEPCFTAPPACPKQAPVVQAWLKGGSVCGVKTIGNTQGDAGYRFICDSGEQIQPSLVCSGMPDCPDGSDETGCPLLCDWTCSADGSCTRPPCELPCADGSSVVVDQVCDGTSDCPGGDDEACVDRFDCLNHEQSVEFSQLCDGVSDCSNGYDESYCPHVPLGTFFICDDGEAILFPYFASGCYKPSSPRQPACKDGSAPYLPCPPDR